MTEKREEFTGWQLEKENLINKSMPILPAFNNFSSIPTNEAVLMAEKNLKGNLEIRIKSLQKMALAEGLHGLIREKIQKQLKQELHEHTLYFQHLKRKKMRISIY